MRWLILLALLAACEDNLPRPELVENLRILGVRAEPPEGAPGTTVAIEGLIVSPDDAELETIWLACASPATGLDALACVNLAGGAIPPPCSGTGAEVCLLGVGAPEPYVLPDVPGPVYVSVVAAERARGGLLGCQAALMADNQVPDFCRIALKRIPIVRSGALNANPVFTDLTITGEEVTVTLAGGEASEELFLSWFVTAGELDDFRTDGADGLRNLWTPVAQAGRIYVVVRDGRGGESWISGMR